MPQCGKPCDYKGLTLLNQLYVILPALIPAAIMIGAFLVYCVMCWTGHVPVVVGVERRKFSEFFGPFLVRYMLWFLRPVERVFVAGKVSPNFITFTSLAACAASGFAIATNHMATAAWMYILAGVLDILDGRLARATGQMSKAGAFLDSVADRWGELFVFTGFAWFLRDTLWLFAVMFALVGSIMVSYTRARAEGLGISLDGGNMQRAERIALVSLGTLVTAWFSAGDATAHYGTIVIGIALVLTGLGSSLTAIGRWHTGYRKLQEMERAERKVADDLRISGEHPVV